MKELGANVVRVHLQLGSFMDAADKPNEKSLDRLTKLTVLAEKERLYLDLTGLGCYHKKDVPGWYDMLAEKERWDVQARFWEAVAGRCAKSPAIFCYDLMNEPVVPGGKRMNGDWLGPPFGGKHFVQFITLDQEDRPRPDIASLWVRHLTAAIREKDKRHLITVGLVDWSLDRPGLTSGFVPHKIADDLDFISVHLYPKTGKLKDDLDTLEKFAVGKPVVIEETFPLACTPKELDEFIEASKKHAAGWVDFIGAKRRRSYAGPRQPRMNWRWVGWSCSRRRRRRLGSPAMNEITTNIDIEGSTTVRLPETKIKEAILHPDLLIRTRAIRVFDKSFSSDTSVMPLVIRSVETFGREDAYHLIGMSAGGSASRPPMNWRPRWGSPVTVLTEPEPQCCTRCKSWPERVTPASLHRASWNARSSWC